MRNPAILAGRMTTSRSSARFIAPEHHAPGLHSIREFGYVDATPESIRANPMTTMARGGHGRLAHRVQHIQEFGPRLRGDIRA